MNTKVTEFLTEAKSFINTPEKWTKGTFARTEAHKVTSFYNANAVCFCSMGAIHKASMLPRDWRRAYNPAVKTLLMAIGTAFGSIADWNDSPNRTHAEVMAVFDKAIEISKEMK